MYVMKVLMSFSFTTLTALMLVFSTACEKEDPWSLIFDKGSGTPGDPWLISTAEQFDNIRNILDGNYRLVADIDLESHTADSGWTSIGNSEAGFTGTFDGNGHSITGIVKSGIFGFIAEGSVIKDLTLKSVSIALPPNIPNTTTGALVDINEGKIINCKVTGIITGDRFVAAGGLVGLNSGYVIDCHVNINISGCSSMGGITYINYGNITGCYASGTITSTYSVSAGGICVMNLGTISESKASVNISGSSSLVTAGGFVARQSGTITRSYSTGNIELIIRRPVIWRYFSDKGVGGFVGVSSDKGNFNDCYATGNVSVSFDYEPKYFRVFTGGFSGIGGNISNCYAVGRVSGDHSGGLVGEVIDAAASTVAIVTASYYNKETSGKDDVDMGIPKTGEEMMQQTTYEGWDFNNIWAIDEGRSYPYLQWQKRP